MQKRSVLIKPSIYISGDTLMVDELKEIPERYKGQNIDLMLIHLGGTTIPSPKVPLLMVTMDAKQGIELVRLINPDLTIPIHYEFVALKVLSRANANVLSATTTFSFHHSTTSRKKWKRQV